MSSIPRGLVVQALLVAGGIGIYHLALAPKRGAGGGSSLAPDAPRGTDDALAALQRAVEDLKRRASAAGGAAGDASVAALASRLEALEQRLIPTSADTGGRPVGQPLPGTDRAGNFTEEQLTALRAAMDEVEARRATDRETASYRDLVRRVAPNAAPAAQSAATSLLTGFMRKVKTLFVGGSAGETAEDRAATNAKAAAERARLMQDLATVLTNDEVERLSPHVPEFGLENGRHPPNEVPPGAMDAPR